MARAHCGIKAPSGSRMRLQYLVSSGTCKYSFLALIYERIKYTWYVSGLRSRIFPKNLESPKTGGCRRGGGLTHGPMVLRANDCL